MYIVNNLHHSKYGLNKYCHVIREKMISHLNLVNSSMSKFDEHVGFLERYSGEPKYRLYTILFDAVTKIKATVSTLDHKGPSIMH